MWQLSLSLMFLPHIDVFFDLLLYRPTATWNLFTSYNNKITYVCNDDVIFASVLQQIKSKNQSKRVYNSAYNGKVNESPLFHTLSYKIASVNEKEVPFRIISYSYTKDSILSESKIPQLSLFDSRTCGTMLDTEHDTWHSKRFFAPTTVTFDQPCQKIQFSSHQCFQGLP